MSDPTSNVDVALGVEDGKVVMKWQQPTACIIFDPQNAFQIGEAMARAAHEARFGVAPTDESYLAAQIRARITENLRVKAINRVTLMLRAGSLEGKTPGYRATAIVDAILREVT